MSNLHIWTGLLAGWLLYAMFLTGTASYFRREISQWARPEVPVQRLATDAGTATERVVAWLAQHQPSAEQWGILLPPERDPSVKAFWRKGSTFGSDLFDARTGERLAARQTLGGDFFYVFHFQLYYLPRLFGRILVGLAAMFMLVAIVSGVITHKKIFADFFTFRGNRGPRSWLDAHNALSVLGLPFHLMITYTGLVTLMTFYMPWGSNLVYKAPAERQTLIAEIAAVVPVGPPTKQQSASAEVGAMVRHAEVHWGQGSLGQVLVYHPGDAASRVAVVRGDAGRVSTNPQYMVYDGTSGALISVKKDGMPMARTQGVLYALHLGRFSDVVTRWLYFLVSLAGTAMVGTGLVLWTVKRRAKLVGSQRSGFGLRLVERLNVAGIAGLSIAMTAFFWANRVLPSALSARAEWEVHVFFLVWAMALLHAIARPVKQAWREQLWMAAALLGLLPVLGGWTSKRGLFHTMGADDWVFVGFDLVMLALAFLHAVMAFRVGHWVSASASIRTRHGK